MQRIETEFPVFLGEGMEAIGAVRQVDHDKIVVYIENAGDFELPMTAVAAVHDSKVILATDAVGPELVRAIQHQHDREDPRLVG